MQVPFCRCAVQASRTALHAAAAAALSQGLTAPQVFSFKLRGAYNKMASLSAEQLRRGVIASSAGNHAQGVALAASHLVRPVDRGAI